MLTITSLRVDLKRTAIPISCPAVEQAAWRPERLMEINKLTTPRLSRLTR